MSRETAKKTLRFEGELTIYRVAECRQELSDALGKHVPIEIDLAGITEIDGAGLQLLIAAKREAARNQTAMSLVAHSPAVLDVLDLANLSGFFGDPLVLAAH